MAPGPSGEGPMQLHRQGRFRSWLGSRFGGDAALGGRLGRRFLHAGGALTLIYYAFPPHLLIVIPNWAIPIAALVALLVVDGLRLAGRLEVPEIRPHERVRLASYSYFGIAIMVSLVLFPEPIAFAVILGTAIVDPIIGESRGTPAGAAFYPVLPFVVYFALATVSLVGVGHASLLTASLFAAVAGAVAIASERPQWTYLDDDLMMTVIPGLVLLGLALAFPGSI